MKVKKVKQVMSVDEAARFLGVGKAAIYKRIHNGTIAAVKVGNKYWISSTTLIESFDKALLGSF